MNGLTINEFKPTNGKCDSGKLQERTNTESKCNIKKNKNGMKIHYEQFYITYKKNQSKTLKPKQFETFKTE